MTTICYIHLISSHQYLHRNIQVDHKVFPRGGPEEQVEVAPCQPQRLVAVFGYQDVAVGRSKTTDPEHCTLQSLVLGESGHKVN